MTWAQSFPIAVIVTPYLTLASVLSLSGAVVELAYQLQAFLDTGHRYGLAISEELSETISFITIHYLNSNLERQSSSSSTVRSERCWGRSSNLETPSYPLDWATDWSAVNQALKSLSKWTVDIWDHPLFCCASTELDPLSSIKPFTLSADTSQAAAEPATPTQIPEAFPPNSAPKPKPATRSATIQSDCDKLSILTNIEEEGTSADESIQRSITPHYRLPNLPSLLNLPNLPNLLSNLPSTHPHMDPNPMSAGAGLNNPAGPRPSGPPDTDNGLTPVALAQIREMMSQMLQGIQSQQPSGPPGPRGKQGPPGPLSSGGNTACIHWKPHNIGIFWPNIPSSYGTGDVVDDGKEQYYRNVHSFIARIKVTMLSRDVPTIWQNLDNCLKGEAQDWWTNQLAHVTRVSIMYDTNDLDEWIKALEKQFREAPSVALGKLHEMKYTTQDACNGREPSEYVTAIGTAVKGCGQGDTEFAQVLHAFCRINSELRHFGIDEPEENITVQDFIDLLNWKKVNWFDHYTKKERREHSHTEKQQDRSQSQQDGWNNNQGGLYTNSYHNWQLMAQVSPLYGFNNQQRGYEQGFNQSIGYNQGYNQRGGAFPSHFPNKDNPAYGQQQGWDAPPTVAVNQQALPPPSFQNLCPYNGGTAPPPGANVPNRYRSGYYEQHFRTPYSPRPLPESRQIAYNDDPHKGAPPPDSPFGNSKGYNELYSNQGHFREPSWDEYLPFPPCYDTQGYYTTPLEFLCNGQAFQGAPYPPAPSALYGDQGPSYHYEDNNSDDHDKANAQFISELTVKPSCHPCQAHKGHCLSVMLTSPGDALGLSDLPEEVIELSATHTHQPEYGFRGWHYATAEVRFERDSKAHSVCFNTGCSITLIDRDFLSKVAPNTEVHRSGPVNVNEIAGSETTHKYTLLELWISGIVKTPSGLEKRAVGWLNREAQIVNDLKAKLLVGTDVLGPEQIDLLFTSGKMVIHSCGDLVVPISTTAHATQQVKRLVQTKRKTIIEPHTLVKVPIQLWGSTDLPDRTLMFQPEYHNATRRLAEGDGAIYAHVVNSDIAFIQICNDSDKPISLGRHAHLGYITECLEEDCYMVSPEAHSLAGKAPTKIHWSSWVWRALTAVSLVSGIAQAAFSGSPPLPDSSQPITPVAPAVDTSLEAVLPSSITVYGKPEVLARYAETVDRYPDLWVDKGWVAKLPEKDWMTIPLIDGWDPSKVAAKVYSTTGKDCDEIDKAFNKLHEQGWMEFSNELTPFAYSVFVMWRTIVKGDSSTMRKARVVVDIHSLNKITLPDSYPLPRQSDIISAVRGCPYISTMDGVAFFYQWLVSWKDCHKLTVTTHQGLEHFNVAVIGFQNSPPYVQRQIDQILRSHRTYAQAYINDIVVFSKTLEEHIAHLDTVFKLLDSLDIVLAPTKTFLGFSSTTLLGQKVDSLSMAAAAEKIQAISKLAFPITLQDLEHYLSLTGWLRDYVPYYAQIVESLQARKTEMLRDITKSESSGRKRKIAAHSTRLVEPTDVEIAAFTCLQGILSKGGFLHHFDPLRRLYVDLDSSKKGIGVIVYHVKGDPDPPKATDIHKSDIQPIMFLSKLLSTAESHYWPTELETAGLVWTVKKIRHLIDSTDKLLTIAYTDHSAVTSIAKQTTLSSSNTDKLNTRLIWASQYLAQFNLDIWYKSGKHHLMPDTLFWLPVKELKPERSNILDGLTEDDLCAFIEEAFRFVHNQGKDHNQGVFNVTLVELANEFKDRLKQVYISDTRWSAVRQSLQELENNSVTALYSDFKLRNDLIYLLEDDGNERLVVPQLLEKKVFKMSHDSCSHQGFHWAFAQLISSVYLDCNVSRCLWSYIEHCSVCQINQTKRHKLYGNLQPIHSGFIPFDTIAMDFVVALPEADYLEETVNALLNVTDKFSKRVLMIPGKDTFTVKD